MIIYDSSFSEDAFHYHSYSFDGYHYKLKLQYIAPVYVEENLRWNLVIDGKTDYSGGISINLIGRHISKKSILDTLISNLEGYCENPNSRPFADNIYSNIEELTEKFHLNN